MNKTLLVTIDQNYCLKMDILNSKIVESLINVITHTIILIVLLYMFC